MKRCPLCYAEHQHIPALFTDLMHINHLTTSTYRHRIRSPLLESDNVVWTQGVGVGGCDDGGRGERRPEIARRGKCSAAYAHLPVSQRERASAGRGLPAARLDSFSCRCLSVSPPPAYAAFCKAEHTEAGRGSKLHRPTGLNSLSNLSGHLKVFPPCCGERRGGKKLNIETDDWRQQHESGSVMTEREREGGAQEGICTFELHMHLIHLLWQRFTRS